jgi:hypothetical protein
MGEIPFLDLPYRRLTPKKLEKQGRISEKELKEARLLLINRTKDVIKEGLALLGIEAPERM